jgi:hypothetical protein
VSGPPPPLSKDTKTALADSAKLDPIGAHVPGKDSGSKAGIAQSAEGEKKVKSEKEREETP